MLAELFQRNFVDVFPKEMLHVVPMAHTKPYRSSQLGALLAGRAFLKCGVQKSGWQIPKKTRASGCCPGYIGFEAFEEIMIQRYAAQDPMDEIRKAFATRQEGIDSFYDQQYCKQELPNVYESVRRRHAFRIAICHQPTAKLRTACMI